MEHEFGERYRLNDLVLDIPKASLTRGEEPIAIAGLTFDLLVFFLRCGPNVIPYEKILDSIWSGSNVGEETLKQRVRLLRKALGDDPQSPSFIKTIRGRGYQWIAETEPLQDFPKTSKKRRLGLKAFVLASFLVLLGIAALFLLEKEQNGSVSVVSTPEDLYMRAAEYYHRYLPADNEKAIGLLKQAILENPDYAQAYALLSRAYSQQPKLGNGNWRNEALVAADKAINLKPRLADGYISLGLHYEIDGFPSKGLNAYQQALERDPENGVALANSANCLFTLGRLKEALDYNVRGMTLYPDSQFGMVQMGDMLRLLGFQQKAETWYQKANTLQPDNVLAKTSYSRFLLLNRRFSEGLELLGSDAEKLWGGYNILNCRGDFYLALGDLEMARIQFEPSAEKQSLYASYKMALIRAREETSGAEVLIEKLIEELERSVAKGYECSDIPYYLSALHLAKNDRVVALKWLGRAMAAGWSDLDWLRLDPAFEALNGDAEFTALIQKLQTRLSTERTRAEDAGIVP